MTATGSPLVHATSFAAMTHIATPPGVDAHTPTSINTEDAGMTVIDNTGGGSFSTPPTMRAGMAACV